MTATLELEKVVLRIRGRTILDRLSLAIEPGEVLALLGPSGSGKTSVLRVALGLETPQAGMVRVAGNVASEGGRLTTLPEDRGLAVVFQDLALWPHLTVSDHLAFGLASQCLSPDERNERVRTTLQQVGIPDKARSYPGQLSGGERQRVAIARALVMKPRAVLFDEPLANLDVVLRNDLLRLFRQLLKAGNTAALYVSHELREAAALGDRIAVIERGNIVQSGSLEKLCAQPASEFARRLVADLATPRDRFV